MKPANLLRTGGQELLITTADKFRKPLLIKIKEKYFKQIGDYAFRKNA